jgi:hypothetical protein
MATRYQKLMSWIVYGLILIVLFAAIGGWCGGMAELINMYFVDSPTMPTKAMKNRLVNSLASFGVASVANVTLVSICIAFWAMSR